MGPAGALLLLLRGSSSAAAAAAAKRSRGLTRKAAVAHSEAESKCEEIQRGLSKWKTGDVADLEGMFVDASAFSQKLEWVLHERANLTFVTHSCESVTIKRKSMECNKGCMREQQTTYFLVPKVTHKHCKRNNGSW